MLSLPGNVAYSSAAHVRCSGNCQLMIFRLGEAQTDDRMLRSHGRISCGGLSGSSLRQPDEM